MMAAHAMMPLPLAANSKVLARTQKVRIIIGGMVICLASNRLVKLSNYLRQIIQYRVIYKQ